MYELEELQRRCIDKMRQILAENKLDMLPRYEDCWKLLQHRSWYADMEESNIRLILWRLGYSMKQGSEFVNTIAKPLQIRGHLIRSREDGTIFLTEAPLNPGAEEYYEFDDGLVFMYRNRSYYCLRNGEWVYNAGLERMVGDAQYGYHRLSYQYDMLPYLHANINRLPIWGLVEMLEQLEKGTLPEGLSEETAEEIRQELRQEIDSRKKREPKIYYRRSDN